MQSVRVGVIGCGKISEKYLAMAKRFSILDVVACADLNLNAAEKRSVEFGIPRACTVEEILRDESIEIILNLTVPKAHVPVTLQALDAGKYVYSEKPIGINRQEAQKIMMLAAAKNLLVGCAPDTFMGAGLQTTRQLIDGGAIGKPIAFTAFMLFEAPETWHPSPEFLYETGGGPMLDMGPYYLTALINLLGSVKRIFGSATIAVAQRTITSQPKFGKLIEVKTPDHVVGTIEFQNGCSGTIITSFATSFSPFEAKNPITIFGSEGTIKVPDPNYFDYEVYIQRAGDSAYREFPHTFVKGYERSLGLADMAYALRSGRKLRASGEMAFAVLDMMEGFLDSSATGRAFIPAAKAERPAPMQAGLRFGTLDE